MSRCRKGVARDTRLPNWCAIPLCETGCHEVTLEDEEHPRSRAEYLVLASSIPPKSIKSTWKLFRGAFAVRRQLLNTNGVMGFSMLAEPLRREYATLSVWRDQTALDAFARAHPHDQLVVALDAGDGRDQVRAVDRLGQRWTPLVEGGTRATEVNRRTRACSPTPARRVRPSRPSSSALDRERPACGGRDHRQSSRYHRHNGRTVRPRRARATRYRRAFRWPTPSQASDQYRAPAAPRRRHVVRSLRWSLHIGLVRASSRR